MKKEVILSVDPSTRMGLVVLSVENYVIDVLLQEEYSSKNKGMERLGDIGHRLYQLLGEYKPTKVVVEGYSFASKHNLVTMAEVGTVIRYFLWQEGYKPTIVAPTALKKFITGKGNCKKDLILLNVFKNWGFDTDNDNIADAFGLAMYIVYSLHDLVKKDNTTLKSNAKLFALNIK